MGAQDQVWFIVILDLIQSLVEFATEELTVQLDAHQQTMAHSATAIPGQQQLK